MKNLKKLMLGMLFIPIMALGQTSKTDYTMVQLSRMQCKVGKNMEFEAAVKKHDAKYHTGKYAAVLWSIETGSQAGDYVWAMGPLTYTDMDKAPGAGEHAKDWKDTVEPFVQEYGAVEYWKMDADLSFRDDKSQKRQTVWLIDLERGDYYKFAEFMKKVVVVNKKMGDEVSTWVNQYGEDDGRDVAIVFTFETFAELDIEDWKMKDEYNKAHGEGTWDNALDDWNEFTKSIKRSIWSRVE